jgi:hypothetical protein
MTTTPNQKDNKTAIKEIPSFEFGDYIPSATPFLVPKVTK